MIKYCVTLSKIIIVTIKSHLGREMGLVVRKPVYGVSVRVRHKPGCKATEDG